MLLKLLLVVFDVFSGQQPSSSIVCSNESKVCSHQLQHDKQEGLIQCWSNFWIDDAGGPLSSGVNYLFWDTKIQRFSSENGIMRLLGWCLNSIQLLDYCCKMHSVAREVHDHHQQHTTKNGSYSDFRSKLRRTGNPTSGWCWKRERKYISNQIEFWTAVWQRAR